MKVPPGQLPLSNFPSGQLLNRFELRSFDSELHLSKASIPRLELNNYFKHIYLKFGNVPVSYKVSIQWQSRNLANMDKMPVNRVLWSLLNKVSQVFKCLECLSALSALAP